MGRGREDYFLNADRSFVSVCARNGNGHADRLFGVFRDQGLAEFDRERRGALIFRREKIHIRIDQDAAQRDGLPRRDDADFQVFRRMGDSVETLIARTTTWTEELADDSTK